MRKLLNITNIRKPSATIISSKSSIDEMDEKNIDKKRFTVNDNLMLTFNSLTNEEVYEHSKLHPLNLIMFHSLKISFKNLKIS
jgi:hypothetical protein